MQIKLINCNTHLLALGIDMNEIGSGSLLAEQLPSNYESWEYDFPADTLLIVLPDSETIPDMSYFGEVVPG